MKPRYRRHLNLLLVLSMLGGLLWVAPVAQADSRRCERRNVKSVQTLLECVDVDGVREHQRSLQRIADRNDGTRASGTPGYDASVEYVVKKMRAAGYTVTVDPFVFDFFEVLAPTTFSQVSPVPTTYVDGTDFSIMDYSGSGTISGVVTPVDVLVPIGNNPPGSSSSGCEPGETGDFAGFVPGSIALMQRGTCPFADKAANAEAAGASAVIIFNEGQPPVDGSEDRTALLLGTLGGVGATIPVIGTTYALGAALTEAARLGPVTVSLFTETLSETRDTANVFAESRKGDATNVVMAGAHLDSVTVGPGINDNGSGTSALLEIAEEMAKTRTNNKVRFAWWGAEENGLVGSIDWVVRQDELGELANVALYLNFDMIGSPNFVRFIYDGDNSDTGAPGDNPPGSGAIEKVFERYFRRIPTEPTVVGDRSDHFAFAAFGIPVGGLFTGAEELKTPEQAAVFGGEAGVALDPCYHQACDTYRNVSKKVLGQMSDAAAYAIFNFAKSTRSVDEEIAAGAAAAVAPLRAAPETTHALKPAA